MADRVFRFGLVAAGMNSAAEWTAQARKAESMGFSTILLPDATTVPSSFPYLAAAAAATETLRVGNFVLAAPLRTAGSIAWDAAAIDQLSQGRFELGLGAGRPGADLDARVLGVPFGKPGERVAKVGEIIEAVRGIFTDAVSGKEGLGAFQPLQRPAPPIMVAAGGDRLLSIAARQADIVAVQADAEENLGAKVNLIREVAGDRFDDLELSANVFAIGDGDLPPWVAHFGVDTSLATDNRLLAVLNGDTGTAIDVLKRRRDSFGISYVTINAFALKAAAPVVERLAGS
ncbi:MAG TPA: TIGR03621 family F420-dependent LLM class oxidoreductase [Amycolatopsis sp.]|uniref:TIGR03621 family F420-dependent LLM class oxidoreductase n=1 Tax=Amycolatopsis sp. TaxID=37632 RepID=UPI002B463991|nr:TIGR03621 family F420-dependent LLM class oxidoreductase [Amycolatopsis sp.]HKS47928.1 TIGR03621 family F420-dependent LLM class oxidoreductase [Amycolatopsis sp.]